jgi:hypothetical protein
MSGMVERSETHRLTRTRYALLCPRPASGERAARSLNAKKWVRGTYHTPAVSIVPLTEFERADKSAQPSPRSRGEGIVIIAAPAAPES